MDVDLNLNGNRMPGRRSFSLKALNWTASFLVFTALLAGCGEPSSMHAEENQATRAFDFQSSQYSVAIFAGGCFWCMEAPFEKIKGVQEVYSGYTGGKKKGPSYHQVSLGSTKHIESVAVLYDPSVISYRELLQIFWQNINPMQDNGQFYDIGNQYRTVIFYRSESEKQAAEESKRALEESGRFEKPIVTRIVPFKDHFWLAEDYHQDYYKKNPSHYQRYRKGSGRDDFIQKYWDIQH